MAKQQGYVDGSAWGEAPTGPQPMGQPAGEMFPGNGRLSIDRSNPNPSLPDKRVEALYATIEFNALKSEAGERMMKQLKARGIK